MKLTRIIHTIDPHTVTLVQVVERVHTLITVIMSG